MPNGVDSNDYRQRLINAMAITVARDGYHGAKIQDIAREAKVSLRTFYSEFANKEECYLALYDQSTRVVERTIVQELIPERPWPEHMATGFAAYFNLLATAPRLTQAALVEMRTLSPKALAVREANLNRFELMMCQEVEKARAIHTDIPSRPLTQKMARAVIGAMTELMLEYVQRDEFDRLPELVEVATDLLWSVVTNVSNPAFSTEYTPAFAGKSGDTALKAASGADVRR